jgi:hypothetical protein
MALKTEIWVKAHLRRCFAAGLTGVVARRGAPEAGSVFVKVTLPGGTGRVLAPAPGPTYDEAGGRRWVTPLGDEPAQPDVIDHFFARQIAVDPDIWILDIDDPTGTGLLDQPCDKRPGSTRETAFAALGNR